MMPTHQTHADPGAPLNRGQCLTIAGLAIVALPTPWGWIGLAAAMAGSLVHPKTLWNNTRALMGRPVLWLWLAWWLTIAASMAWSPDLGMAHPEPLLMTLLIPAAASLGTHRNAVVLALAVGLSINICVQMLQWADVLQSERFRNNWISAGLFDYPPFAALWSAVLLMVLLPMLATAPTWQRLLGVSTLAALCVIGVLLAASKVVLLAGGAGVLIVGTALVLRRFKVPGRMAKIGLIATGMVIAAIVTMIIVQSLNPKSVTHRRLKGLVRNVEAILSTPDLPPTSAPGGSSSETPTATRHIPSRKHQTRMQTSFGLRVLWWNATGPIVMEAPVFGHGAGSTRDQLARAERTLPTDLAAGIQNFIIEDPHSSLLATAIEQGLLGAVLLLLCIGTALWTCVRATLRDVPHIGLTVGWCVLGSGALVHTLQFTPWMAALGMMMIVLTAWLPPTHAAASRDETTYI